jgi:hypothetical protein
MVDNSELTTISELIPHAIYTIRVQAFTSMGAGPMSTPVQVKTQQGIFGIGYIWDRVINLGYHQQECLHSQTILEQLILVKRRLFYSGRRYSESGKLLKSLH